MDACAWPSLTLPVEQVCRASSWTSVQPGIECTCVFSVLLLMFRAIKPMNIHESLLQLHILMDLDDVDIEEEGWCLKGSQLIASIGDISLDAPASSKPDGGQIFRLMLLAWVPRPAHRFL